MNELRLGVNIDHVATVRNARQIATPSPIRAAKLAESAGAHGITAHLREDRRHIVDADMFAIKEAVSIPLNMEMAATDEMLKIALQVRPNACCIVPEKRKEVTTEGGLDVAGNKETLLRFASEIKNAGIRVSLFIDADEKQILASKEIGADIVELHTGAYCHKTGSARKTELERIINAAKIVGQTGIECHAGHGLCFETVAPITKISNMVELNIGHFLIGEAIFLGLEGAINKMLKIMNEARG